MSTSELDGSDESASSRCSAALELAAEDQLARPTLLGELPQLRLGHGLVLDDGAEPFLQRGVERLGDRRPYIPIEWYPEST